MEKSPKSELRVRPLIQRVWLWVKDHPDKSSTEIAKALGVPLSQASAQLSELFARKMVTRKEVPARRKSGGPGTSFVYTVSIKEYELLHRPPKAKASPKESTASGPTPPSALTTAETMPLSGTVAPIPKALERLTLAECQLVYVYLRNLFGGGA